MRLSFTGYRYYQKFGLDKDPFPADFPRQKVFLTHDMIHCLDQIKAAVDSSDQLVVATAPKDAGKSVLSRYLAYIKGPNWFVGHVQGHREMDRETLAFQIIRQHFPERQFVQTQAVSLLKDFLQLFARNGRTPVVIIDDAHLLPPDTLRFALQLAADRQQDVHYRFVLFADVNMDEKLKDPNLRELIPQRYHHFRLPILSLQQTHKYLEYRLGLCGECIEDPFDDVAVEQIFRESVGLPGAIHAPARRIMQQYQVQGESHKQWLRLAVAAPLCLLVFSGVYSAMNEDYTKKSAQAMSAPTRQTVALNLPGTGKVIKPVAGQKRGQSQTRELPVQPVETVAVEQKTAAAEMPRQEGFFSRLFNSWGEVESDHTTGKLVASLDSQYSLILSDIINE